MSFTSKGSALVILLGYNPNAVESDIPDYFVTAADDEINERSDTQWEVDAVDQTFLIDGNGFHSVFTPVAPIVSLTSIKLIRDDESKTNLVVSGENREVRFNAETGEIRRITGGFLVRVERGELEHEGTIFPEGTANVEIIGRFGRSTTADLLRLLANMIILRNMAKKEPNFYRLADITSEKIGKYSYTIGGGAKGGGEKNTSSLPGFINYLFSLLPMDDKISVLGV